MLKHQPSISELLLALALTVGLSTATSFLSAYVFMLAWGWFIVPAAPTVLSELTYPAAYGVSFGLSLIHLLVNGVKDSNDDQYGNGPIAGAITSWAISTILLLISWGIAAIVHNAIG